MDASDADAPVVTPYSGSKMDAPASPPCLQQQQQPSSSPQSCLNSQPATTSTAPDNTTGTDATKLSTAERIKLSVAALITGRDSVTPAADHFTVLPGGSPRSRGENFSTVVRQNPDHQQEQHSSREHAIRHGLSTDPDRKHWGTEGLLRSKTRSKSGTAGGVAVDVKQKLSAHLGMSAKRGEEEGVGGGEQHQEHSCEYVAMTTPCESPVAGGGEVDHEGQQWGPREDDRRNSSTSTHSSSSRTGLVTRLGSALQSWTSGGGSSKSWGSSSTAAREGRPGPLGARYTQQAPESYSPFEPSPHHQLQTKLPVKTAFTAAAAARRGEEPACTVADAVPRGEEPACTVAAAVPRGEEPACTVAAAVPRGEEPACTVAAATPRGEEPACTVAVAAPRGEVQGGAPDEELNVTRSDSRPAGSDGRPETITTADTMRPNDGGYGPESAGTQQSALKESEKDGRNTPPQIDGSTHSTPSPDLRQGSRSDMRKASLDRGEGLGADGSPVTAGTAAAATGSSDDVNRVGNGDKPVKKAGIWELKAERSRLESALAEAESDRDVEKARAWEAANRLEEAVARLESVMEYCST